MGKQARMEGIDRISNLPDPVLSHILSFLPIKEAVRTSILSTSWSKVFSLVSNLIFEFDDRLKKPSYSFMNFVDRVLFQRTGDVDKFHLNVGKHVDPYRIDGWIQYALSNRVREIDLQLLSKEFYRLPFDIFSCNTLEVLKLDIRSEDRYAYLKGAPLKVPLKISCPSLKILHLDHFEFSDEDSIRRLFSGCLMLEELVLKTCIVRCKFNLSSPTLKRLTIGFLYYSFATEKAEFVIDAPNLVSFKCLGLPKSLLLKNLSSLVEAYIDLRTNLYHKKAETDLFKGISNVQSLHLIGRFGEAYPGVCSLIGELPKVTYLNLDCHFWIGWERVLADLLTCFPCLEAFDIKVSEDPSLDINKVMVPSKEFPPFLWSQLKKMQILSYKGEKYEFQMIEYFLKNAQVLEKLTVQTIPTVDKNLLKELSKKWKLVSVI